MLTDILINIFVGMTGIVIGNRYALCRDRRIEFNNATEKIRNLIRNEIHKNEHFIDGRVYEISYTVEEFIPKWKRKRFKDYINEYEKACKDSYQLRKDGYYTFIGNKNHNRKLLLKISSFVRRK